MPALFVFAKLVEKSLNSMPSAPKTPLKCFKFYEKLSKDINKKSSKVPFF